MKKSILSFGYFGNDFFISSCTKPERGCYWPPGAPGAAGITVRMEQTALTVMKNVMGTATVL